MVKVLIGSENPVKINATLEAFSKYFNDVKIHSIKVSSDVPDQPVGDQTFKGAENRAIKLREISKRDNLNADFFVGIEGGIVQLFSKWFAFGCMCILDKNERMSYGMSPFFELPAHITEQLLNGKELGHVIDEMTGEKNTKQNQGAVGFFTKGVMNRKEFYVNGLIVALIPLLNKDLYFR